MESDIPDYLKGQTAETTIGSSGVPPLQGEIKPLGISTETLVARATGTENKTTEEVGQENEVLLRRIHSRSMQTTERVRGNQAVAAGGTADTKATKDKRAADADATRKRYGY